MPRRDYKSRASRSKGKKPVSAWVWLLIGFVLGASTVGFLCLKYAKTPATDNWIGARPPSTEAVTQERKRVSPEPAKVKPPRFDFYNLLPDQEVLVPDEEIERQVRQTPPPKQEQPQPAKPATGGKRYIVQVSSFRSNPDAQALRAKLGLLGLRARVNKANIKGSTWYRVQLGPYSSAAAMQDVRKQLASSGYKSLAIALKK
ncbi:SPOR domain-containing protein [Thiolapillus sp.]